MGGLRSSWENLTLNPSPKEREDLETYQKIDAKIIANPEGVQLCITMGAAHGPAQQVEKPHPRSLSKGEGGLVDRLED